LLNETNSKELHQTEKETFSKLLNRFNGENVHYNRTLEKNKLFKEDKDEKNRVVRSKTIENFNEVEKSVVKSILDYQGVFQKYESNTKKIVLDAENNQLIQNINK
jgi:broad-specificity NMP kinase